MRLDLGQTPTLIVSSARLAQEVMKNHDLTFSDRPKSGTFFQLLYDGKDLASAPYGEYWRQMRSICAIHLLHNRRVQSFSSVREEEIEILLEKIEQESRVGFPIDVADMFALTTNNIICRVALGRKYCEGEEGRRFKRLLKEFVELLGGFSVGDFIPSLAWVNWVSGLESKVKRVANEFDEFLERVIEERIADREGGIKTSVDGRNKDLVDVLLEVERDGLAGNFPFSRINIKALLLDIFAAGADTTYTLLEWATTELFRNPGAMTKLQTETRNISNGRAKITEEDLNRMPYLKSVFKETLRLHPPILLLIPRVANQDVTLDGYDVAAGTMVITNAWAIGRDKTSWDQPEEFMPERFLGSPMDYKGQDFEFIPFGSGRRGCPGVAFAIAVNELMLANLVNRFNWALPESRLQELRPLYYNVCLVFLSAISTTPVRVL